jgi:hypothetical protein
VALAVDSTFALRDGAHAHEAHEAGGHLGKIAVMI